MKGRITGFRGNRRGVRNNYCVIDVEEENPAKLIGKKVFWKTSTGKIISGKISRLHGADALLGKFVKGLPGHAIGNFVDIGRPIPRAVEEVKKPKVVPPKKKKPEKKVEVKPLKKGKGKKKEIKKKKKSKVKSAKKRKGRK